jgi:F-type H+-transporting ATPase subunit delta
MKTPKQARRDAKELFRSCIANGRLGESRVRTAVSKVIELKPRGFQSILSHFQRLVRLDVQRHTAEIESAIPLAADFQAAVRADLTRLHGAGLDIAFSQDSALIGGLRIKVGSDVYDGSIQARLAALREKF